MTKICIHFLLLACFCVGGCALPVVPGAQVVCNDRVERIRQCEVRK